MTIEELKTIESSLLDYKVSLESSKPRSWLKSVSAFANTRGGHIIFGISDDGQSVGLADVQKTASKIAELITERIEPKAAYVLTPLSSEDKQCIDVYVYPGRHCPYYYRHEQTRECYVRRGDRSEPATVLELNNLILKGSHLTYDALPSAYKINDVSFTLLSATFKKETGEPFDLLRDLMSMELILDNDVVSNAGLLLCDQGYLKHSRIVCTRWKGTHKGTVNEDALDDEEFSGASLIMLLANAEAFIRTHSKKPWTIRGMKREEMSDYPFRAVREVLVNALIHRDYQNIGSEVHVDIYDDRMEISSPGGMMNGSRIQDLDLQSVPSMRRNEIISDIFGRLHYMDRRGSGISRIMNSYSDVIEKPDFYSNEFFFRVVLPNRSEVRIVKDDSLEVQDQLLEEKMQLTPEKTQLTPEKMQLTPETFIPLSKRSDEEIRKWLQQKSGGIFRNTTIKKLASLFIKHEYTYSFNRNVVASHFGISENSASRILKKSVESGIMRKEKKGIYYFLK